MSKKENLPAFCAQILPASKDALVDRRSQILSAAMEAFCEQGYSKTRIEDVAHRAEVGKGTVYEYFRSKSELLVAACFEVCQLNEKSVLDIIQAQVAGKEEDPARVLFLLLRTLFEVVPSSASRHLSIFVEVWKVIQDDKKLFNDYQQRFGQKYQAWETQLLELYQAGLNAQRFRPSPSEKDLPRLVTGFLDGLVWQMSFRKNVFDVNSPKNYAKLCLSLLLKNPEELEHLCR